MANKTNKQNADSKEVAEHSYDPTDYQSSNQVERGLATTHEQVSDAYEEGTVDEKIENSQEGVYKRK